MPVFSATVSTKEGRNVTSAPEALKLGHSRQHSIFELVTQEDTLSFYFELLFW